MKDVFPHSQLLAGGSVFLEAEATLEYLGLEAPRQRQSWGQPQGTLGLGLPLALGAEYKYSTL